MQASISQVAAPAAVTVVIPSHSGAGTIIRTVESALSQNDGNVAVVVVIDDGCELTRQLLADLHDERIRIVTNETNKGASASRNRGLELVATRYVAFLDADDRFDGDFLGPLIREMEKRGTEIGFGPSVRWSPRHGYQAHCISNYRDHEHAFSEWLGKRRNVNTSSVLWLTQYVRGIGGWDTQVRRNQDGEIALRAILMGASFAISKDGAGVWTDDRSLPRITTSTDNLGSLLYITDKFLSMQSDVVPETTRIEACARYCLTIAHLAYSTGQDEIGRQALQRRRALGYADTDGDWKYVISASLRIVPRAPRLLLWRILRKAVFKH